MNSSILRNLKIIALSDLCLTESIYQSAFADFVRSGSSLQVINWPLRDLSDLRAKVIKTEREGPEAVAYPADLDAAAADADILVTHICPVPAGVIAKAGRLKALGCARSAFENVDLKAANRKRVPLLFCPTSKIATAADATIGMILAECRGLARAHCKMMRGEWDANYAFFGHTTGLAGNTVGLIGFGNIGKAVAQRLTGFGVKLLVFDPYQPPEAIGKSGGSSVPLEELLRASDFVLVLARLDESTKNLIGAKEFALMKNSAYFVNTARAGLVDYAALRRVLAERRIAGAALDVFDREPIAKDDPLLQLDNVTLTPHVAGVSIDGYQRSARDLVEDIQRLLENKKPNHVANPEVLQ